MDLVAIISFISSRNNLPRACNWFILLSAFLCCQPTETTNNKVGTGTTQNLDLSWLPQMGGVMLQAFYWDVEPRFEWWDNITSKLPYYQGIGVNRIWLPPVSKGQSGAFSMGYDPSDYYDLGEYFQHHTTETRFGSREELEKLIATAHDLNIEVIADIVMGHNSGGGSEFNPYRNKNTFTAFNRENGNASGLFNRTFEDFHPNSIQPNDEEALFFPETDLSHAQENVQNWLWKNENSVAKYYKNSIGFDGWRFDYVKSFHPRYVKSWMNEVGGWAVGEYFDGNADLVRDWIAESGTNAFDFPCLFVMQSAFKGNNLNVLHDGDTLWKSNPDEAVTFVANHDTDREPVIADEFKSLAYAFILTHPGYPTIFYSDLENNRFKKELENLININRTLALGAVEVVFVDDDEYIAIRKGSGRSPGLLIYINIGNDLASRTIETPWRDVYLADYSNNINGLVKAQLNGNAMLFAPAKSYAIWSINDIENR